MKNDNPLLNATLKIDWQIEQYFETIDYHTKSVSLIGYDGFGQKYTAMALEVCGDIENIENIERDENQSWIRQSTNMMANANALFNRNAEKLNTDWK